MTIRTVTRQLLAVLIGLALLGGCSSNPSDEMSQDIPLSERPSIADIIDRRGEDFLAIEGVVVIFEGATFAGDPCIKIGVAELNDELESNLPKQLEGWPVIIFESGVIEPMDGR